MSVSVNDDDDEMEMEIEFSLCSLFPFSLFFSYSPFVLFDYGIPFFLSFSCFLLIVFVDFVD
jgi:hypothetical protein